MLYTNREIATVLHASGLLEVVPAATMREITGLYGDETRHYHDFDHVTEVLSWLNRVLEDIPEKDLAPFTALELRLAALFHDVVYTSEGSPNNELRSCELFDHMLGDQMPPEAAEHVTRLIMFTAEHGKLEASQVPLAGQLMLDADIASLGQPRWEIFLYNNQNVVEELKLKYTAEQIAVGRKAFLAGLLAKNAIFLSDWFRVRFEDQARRNLTRVLAEEPKESKKRGRRA